jgi:hypothetical protein
MSNMATDNPNPSRATLMLSTKTREKIRKVKDTILARGSNLWIGESIDANASISGYSIKYHLLTKIGSSYSFGFGFP